MATAGRRISLIALAAACVLADGRAAREREAVEDASRAVRRQQLGRHGGRRRPAHVQAAHAHQHHPRPRERLAEIASRSRRARLLPRDPPAGGGGPRPVRRRHVLLPRRPAAFRLAARASPTSSAIDLRTRRSSGARSRRLPRRPHGDLARRDALLVSASTAKVVDCSTRAPARSSAASRPATSRTRTTSPRRQRDLPREHRLGVHAARRAAVRRHRRASASSRSSTRARYRSLKRIDIGKKLAEAGYPGMSSAVRPMALSPDERFVYFQVSFLHGFVEYDLKRDRVTRIATLPLGRGEAMPPRDYLLDSAHHGLAMNPQGTKLCAAGTMSDYAAIVEPRDVRYKSSRSGTSRTGRRTAATAATASSRFSGDDRVAVISYATRKDRRAHPGRRPPAAHAHRDDPPRGGQVSPR